MNPTTLDIGTQVFLLLCLVLTVIAGLFAFGAIAIDAIKRSTLRRRARRLWQLSGPRPPNHPNCRCVLAPHTEETDR